MTVIFSLAQSTIGADTHIEHDENIPQNAKRIRLTFTRPVTWPDRSDQLWPVPGSNPPRFDRNVVAVIAIEYPGGIEGPWKTLSGGDVFLSANGKKQAPMVVPAGFRFDDALYQATGTKALIADPSQTVPIDVRMTTDFFEFSWRDPSTGNLDLPKGVYRFKGDTFAAITTAIVGERFNP